MIFIKDGDVDAIEQNLISTANEETIETFLEGVQLPYLFILFKFAMLNVVFGFM